MRRLTSGGSAAAAKLFDKVSSIVTANSGSEKGAAGGADGVTQAVVPGDGAVSSGAPSDADRAEPRSCAWAAARPSEPKRRSKAFTLRPDKAALAAGTGDSGTSIEPFSKRESQLRRLVLDILVQSLAVGSPYPHRSDQAIDRCWSRMTGQSIYAPLVTCYQGCPLHTGCWSPTCRPEAAP